MKSMMSSDQDWKLLHNALTQNTYDIGIRAFEELTAEYSNLRAGIVETDERAIQISNFVIIFTGALAGFATSQLFFASQSQADYLVKTTLFIFMETGLSLNDKCTYAILSARMCGCFNSAIK
jgi:hypothetical protein